MGIDFGGERWEFVHSHEFDARIAERGRYEQLDEQLAIAHWVIARDPESEDSKTGIKDN